MNDMELDEDQASYLKIWRTMMTHVLQWDEVQQAEWLKRAGYPLLADAQLVFHEEPWYWLYQEIAAQMHSGGECDADALRAIQGKLCAILWRVFRDDADDGEKRAAPQYWEEVRSRCREACRVEKG